MKGYIILGAVLISFILGYKISSWHQDSIELVAERAAIKSGESYQQDQKDLASRVITSLDEWKESNRGTNETIIREKVKPVFYNVCVSEPYVKLFNDATNNYQRQADSSGQPVKEARSIR